MLVLLFTKASQYTPSFAEHVAKYDLNFPTQEEYLFRQKIFLVKDSKLKDLNSNPEHTFTVGHNFMSTFTDDEHKKMLG